MLCLSDDQSLKYFLSWKLFGKTYGAFNKNIFNKKNIVINFYRISRHGAPDLQNSKHFARLGFRPLYSFYFTDWLTSGQWNYSCQILLKFRIHHSSGGAAVHLTLVLWLGFSDPLVPAIFSVSLVPAVLSACSIVFIGTHISQLERALI